MPRGRPPKYPWDEWLDGERHVLNSREHFADVTVQSFQQQVLNEAAKREVSVRTRTAINPRGDGIDYLEVAPPSPEPKRDTRIDWDAVFARLPARLVRGDHFECSMESMRVRIYQAAQRRDRPGIKFVRNGEAWDIYPEPEQAPATEMAPEKE